MAVTVNYAILPQKWREDGTNYIRIRITHKRRSRYLITNIALEKDDLTRGGNLKNTGKEDLADAEVLKIRRIVDAMPTSTTDQMDVDEVVRYVKAKMAEGEVFRLNFARYGMELARKKKPGTGKNYIAAMNCLVRYFGHEPDISEVTVRAMRGFEEFVRNEGNMVYHADKGLVEGKGRKTKSERAVNMYTGYVRAVYKSARVEFNDPDLGVFRIPTDIFEYYKVPRIPATRHRDIPVAVVQQMIDQRKELEGRERMAVDAFLLSFGLMGMNAADLYSCTRINDGVVEYNRQKTAERRDDGAYMRVRIEEGVRGLVEEYRGRKAAFSFSEMYSSGNVFVSALNKGLKSWCERNKLEAFTFYSARHTWATLARSKRCGIDKSVVSECLCHVDGASRVDDIYIRKDWEVLWDANAKVLGLLEWK